VSLLLYKRSTEDEFKDDNTLLSLRISSLVTAIAAFHYFIMIISKGSIVSYRYLDWFLTTPLLLIELCLLLNIIDSILLTKVIVLNTIMLLFGLLGELNLINMLASTFFGFIPFLLLFYLIIDRNEKKIIIDNEDTRSIKLKRRERILLFLFIMFWACYGFNHLISDLSLKNFNYNVLDLITKGFFGLYVFLSSKSLLL
jgi:bacteriorhodopsin